MTKGKRNRLASEQSPYLLQHADNPVDWYPWGEEAFSRAREENRPVFLSIGYSTCHWCHVMAHESFEDPEVARLLNDFFISIKVDREERPDIDGVYMTVCQMMTGSGGWPLTIIMTPEKEPFFAATYIPRESRFGNIGLLDLLPRLREFWDTRQADIRQTIDQLKAALGEQTASVSQNEPGEPELEAAFTQLEQRYDRARGGFGVAPKYPTPHNLLLLLRWWKRSGSSTALEMVEKTLQAMRRGGIFDHIGFGFHRYSTDAEWLVPHFEKMLYDEALLAEAYLEAYQATGKPEYARTAEEIFSYVLRDMRSPEGGFYSAEDADSEGEEGKFYTWSLDEITDALAGEDSTLAAQLFNINDKGNFAAEGGGVISGRNILHLTKPVSELAAGLGIPETELLSRIENIRGRLFASREKRVRPHKDDKVLTDWNGLMIAALALGARVLGRPEYAEAAVKASDFLLDTMRSAEGRLLHRYRGGQAAIAGNLDDYAFLVHALIELYQTTFQIRSLEAALELDREMLRLFRDSAGGGFFFTSADAEDILVRRKEIYDGAVPSGNSVVMLNLLRLGRLTADPALEQEAAGIGRAFFNNVHQMPSAYTRLLAGVDFALGPASEVVIAGVPDKEDTRRMLAALASSFSPNKVVVLRPADEASPAIDKLAPYAAKHKPLDGKATAYVCRDYACRMPVTETGEMLKLLDSS